ncbi:RNA 2',3'-cyclic phosphodiesterase [Streptomyces avicenniae]|uniref:RNA 2',3'-cyclic phosphodiesterase n=1 Tax=Streptomyces avicenniae TaxID=500153 RepID=UPI00069B6C67|nr:RNA 2',3'-cyclic phosphodiesterase [Streptomyces avicenniae]
MRLFAAVVPPETITRELEPALAAPRGLPGADTLRWSAPADRHITLAYYGERTPEQRADLLAGLAATAAGTAPFTLGLAGADTFGGRVLWAGVEGDTDALTRLAAAVPRREDERHPVYRPHLTLARGGRGADLAPYAARLAGLRTGRWRVERLLLMGGVDGLPYTTEAAWRLGVPLSG